MKKEDKEIWKDVVGFEGRYKVSNLGRVKSLEAFVKCKAGYRLKKERILKQSKSRRYNTVSLQSKPKPQITITTHKLVMQSFCGYKPRKGFVIDHINNIKTDNRLANLQVITHRENLSKDKKAGSSKYTGVHWCKTRNKCRVAIVVCGKKIQLGRFNCEIEAARAYQNKLKEIEV